MLTSQIVADAVARALAEDAPWGDVTTELVIPADAVLDTRLVAREAGVFAGGPLVVESFRQTDPAIRVTEVVPEGSRSPRATPWPGSPGRHAGCSRVSASP